MDNLKFPEMVSELSGLTFQEAFEQKPKIVEFVDALWLESQCTEIFLDFYKYVKLQLSNPVLKNEHIERCKEFVKNNAPLPTYMQKYLVKDEQILDV